MQKVYAFPIAW